MIPMICTQKRRRLRARTAHISCRTVAKRRLLKVQARLRSSCCAGRRCFDDIVVPLGDGALLGGMARWVKAQCPTTRMIGVCATASPAMERSWRSKRVVSAPCDGTIAAGIAVGTPFEEAVTDLTGLIDDVLLVPDSSLIAAMRLAHRELGIVLEPAGAAGLAALLDHREQFRGRLVATVLTGGNVSPSNLQEWFGP